MVGRVRLPKSPSFAVEALVKAVSGAFAFRLVVFVCVSVLCLSFDTRLFCNPFVQLFFVFTDEACGAAFGARFGIDMKNISLTVRQEQ
jgi:hypothetical protein